MKYSLFFAAALLLGGCAAAMMGDPAALGIFQRQDVNILEKNQAAADYLIHQAQSFVGRGDVIRAVPLTDPEEREIPAPVGRMIPEQVGTRLVALGYKVDLREVSDIYNPMGMGQGPLPSRPADFLLTGTYKRASRDLNINLRLIENSTGRVVAGFDYPLPYTRQIGEQSMPKPKIIRMMPEVELPNNLHLPDQTSVDMEELH